MVCTRRSTGASADKGIVITRPLFPSEDVINNYVTREKDVMASESIKLKNNNVAQVTNITLYHHDHTDPANNIKQQVIYPSPQQKPTGPYTFHQLDSIGITINGQTRYLKGIDSLIKAYAIADCTSKCDSIVINSKSFKKGAVTFAIDAIYKLIVFAQGGESAEEYFNIYGNFVYKAADQVARAFREEAATRKLIGESTLHVDFITPSICSLNNFVSIVASARAEYELKEQELQMKIAAYSLSKATSASATPVATTAPSRAQSVASVQGNACSSSYPKAEPCKGETSTLPVQAAQAAQPVQPMLTVQDAYSAQPRSKVPRTQAASSVKNVGDKLDKDINRENVSRYISWARWQAGELLKKNPNEKILQEKVDEYDVKSYIQKYYAGMLSECEKKNISDYIKKAPQGYKQVLENLPNPKLITKQIEDKLNKQHAFDHVVLSTLELSPDSLQEQPYQQLLNHISGKAVYSNVDRTSADYTKFNSIISNLNQKGINAFTGKTDNLQLPTLDELNNLAQQVFSHMAVDAPADKAKGGGIARKIKVLGRLRTIFLKRGYQYVTVKGEPMLVTAAVKMEKKLAANAKKAKRT